MDTTYTREGEHCSELPDQEVMLDRELVNIWRKHLSFVVFWTTLHCLGGEMDPVLLETATVIDTLGEEEKSLDDIRSGHLFFYFFTPFSLIQVKRFFLKIATR